MEQMEIEKYGITDLTHLVTLTNSNTLPTTIIPHHHQQALIFGNQQHHYVDNNAMMMQMVPTYHDQVCAAAATNCLSTGIESGYDRGGYSTGGGGDNVSVSASGSARWPRQETLTLLEIRSRLDLKFKEATQKGHLWDELSRIMYEEHGYQRSGKKCREKFENLYKYYKKTKEGKPGRRNGKHYRFFLQLEALYGSEGNNKRGPSHDTNLFSLSNSSRYETSDSDNDNDSIEKSRKRTKGGSKRDDKWEVNVKDFIDSQMSKIMEKQEVWLDKMMRSIEDKERERFFREEKWRKQEIVRIEKENAFWANERSWIEARDAALIEALHRLKKKGIDEDELVMNKIRSSGYDNQNFNSDGRGLSLYNHQGGQSGPMLSLVQPNNNNNDGSSSSHSNSNVGNNSTMQESCFRLFMGNNSEHLNPWENYDVKLNNHGGH